jgi:transcriptional regulator with XRE-family HTH domain
VEAVNPEGLGHALERGRLEKGLSREVLARELNLSVQMIEAIEGENWDLLQEGSQRPLTRQIAERLGVEPLDFPQSWEGIPGGGGQDLYDPRRERAERWVMGFLALGSLGLLFWLLVPGPRIPTGGPAQRASASLPIHPPARLPSQAQPFPVLGEVLPEAPRTAEGVLVSLRALDVCEVSLEQEGRVEKRNLQVSEPWRLRVKGDFSIHLLNAGVVKVEVAGRIINHGQAVGEPWDGFFDAEGRPQWPAKDTPKTLPAAPESDSPPDEKGPGG